MRLIDADELRRSVKEHCQMVGMSWGPLWAEIDTAPTVEPKRGKWIERKPPEDAWGLGSVFKCSVCGREVDCEPENFCPNCGAEMS